MASDPKKNRSVLATWTLVAGLTALLSCSTTEPTAPVADEEPATAPEVVADEEPATPEDVVEDPDAAHANLLLKNRFPSARECADCHPKHYREWSISQHAYAQMSPIFNAMHGKILKLTNGTNGDFCIRCHTPVGMNLGEDEFMSNIDRHPTSREGITCIVCHRLKQPYGKLSGRLAIVEGPITDPIYGPLGKPEALNKAIEEGGLVTEEEKAGRKVHGEVEPLSQLSTSGFCGTCHDVNLVNGFRLEEAFSEYKTSPAARKGISCQDCHMGKAPGKVLADRSDPEFQRKNYDFGPAAKVGTLETEPRKLTNHMFVGPDYSVLPPELYPLHPDAIKEESEKEDLTVRGHATIRQWVAFRKFLKENPKHRDTWGTDDDDLTVEEEDTLPVPFASFDDRELARGIVEDNKELLEFSREERLKLLQTGYLLGDIETLEQSPDRIRFRVQVKNGTDGHNVPTGFDAERLLWLYVRVLDADGAVIKQSGDLDPNGDVRDLHSLYVHNHELPQDKELFSLQSKFVTRNLRGGEREQVLAVNYSGSPLPFLRPLRRSSVLIGRPDGARKHKLGIEPLGERWSTYTVSRDQMTGRGPYKAVIQLKAAMVPVNLVNEIRDVGFDYNMSARDVADALVAGHQVIWEREVTFDVGGADGTGPAGQ